MNAQEAMTKDVVTVGPEATVGEIAGLLVRHRISAAPVVSEDNRIAGIVSQTDLGHRSETGTEKKRKSAYVNLAVKDGVVELYGAVDSNEQRRALRILVEGVSGVQKVEDNVSLFPKTAAA